MPPWGILIYLQQHFGILPTFCFGQQRVTEAMPVVVDVGLISGKTVSLQAGLDESVVTLKRRAQITLAVGKGRLLNSDGLLDDELTVKAAKLETGTVLTLQLRRVQIQSSGLALAVILTDSAVVAWGAQDYGGDSRDVQQPLIGVQQIQAFEKLLQLSFPTDRLLPGAMRDTVAAVVLCKSS